MDRLFLAVPAFLEDYESLQKQFEGIVEGRWTPEQNLHATILFLGKRFRRSELMERLGEFPIALEPSTLGPIEYWSRSHVLVATLSNDTLFSLSTALAQAFGIETSEPHLHVTLMRVRRRVDPERLSRLLEEGICARGRLSAEVILYNSFLFPEGAKYEPIARWPQ